MSKFLKKNFKNPVISLLSLKLEFLLLKKGQKVNSKKILYNLLYKIKLNDKLYNRNILNFYKDSLNNVLLCFIIKKRKRGKRLFEIPMILNSKKSVYLNTLRNILQILRKNKGNSFDLLLLKEFYDSRENQGKIKNFALDLNKIVLKNRKFLR